MNLLCIYSGKCIGILLSKQDEKGRRRLFSKQYMGIPTPDLQTGETGHVGIPGVLDKRIVREGSLKVSGETAGKHAQKEPAARQKWKPPVLHQGWAKQGQSLDGLTATWIVSAE